jgi:hypothetical protein
MSQETVKTAVATSVAASAARNKGWANLRPFKPGVSGNPGGRSKRYHELFDAIVAQVGGDSALTAMEREYLSRAAEYMRRAERIKDNNDNNQRVRLTRCAMGLVDRVRDMRRERKRDAPSDATLDQYLTEREGTDA